MVKEVSTGYVPPKLRFDIKKYAQSPNEALPRQYMFAAFIAPRGVGKTYSVCQLIKAYERSPPVDPVTGERNEIRTFVISPTYQQNDAFKSLSSIDETSRVFHEYDPSVLQTILGTIEENKKQQEQYQKELAAFKKFQRMRTEAELGRLTPEELYLLEKCEFQRPEPVPAVSWFLVVDDMLGSPLFKNGKNPFVQVCIKNRHHRLNVILLSQSLKAIPRTLRNNVSVWWVGRFASDSILPDLYEECGSALCTEQQFDELYHLATEGEHGALVVDFTKERSRRFSRSFQTYLQP